MVEKQVSPAAKGDALTFLILGVVVFAITMLLFLADLELPKAAWGLLWIASAALFFLGAAKIYEPKVSLVINPETIRYEHRRGTWQIEWDNIVRFDVPRIAEFMKSEDLPYLGFRLRSIEPVLAQISPRLAVHLVSEQRHLLVAALRRERPDLHDYSPYFDLPDKYTAETGKVYRGVQALFAVRCEQLRELLGYDLYVPASALDRPIEDFVSWLKQLQDSRQNAQ